MTTLLEAHTVTAEIERLLAEFPELAEDEDLRRDTIEGQTDAFAILAEMADRIAHASEMQKAIKARVDTIKSRADRYAKAEEAWRRFAFRIMQAAQLRKAELPEATISIRAVPPSAIVTDEAALPEWAWRVKKEIDKSAIKDRLKAGEFVPGAEMTNGSETLSVRT